MCKYAGYILIALLLHCSIACMAQPEEVYYDTVAQTVIPAPTEDGERVSFSPITQQQPVETKKIPAGKVNELKADEAYWYANLEPEKPKEEVKDESNWFQNLLWIIILCSFIAVVIWYLASSNIRLFRKESKSIMEDETADVKLDDIFTINYEKEIQKAVDAKNYRLAIRLWYLRTLKELSDRNIIEYRHEKTNNEYVSSLFNSRYYKDFFRLTRNFEYTWYGQFNLSAESYQMMQADFLRFKNNLA
jgi:hypothetical protein